MLLCGEAKNDSDDIVPSATPSSTPRAVGVLLGVFESDIASTSSLVDDELVAAKPFLVSARFVEVEGLSLPGRGVDDVTGIPVKFIEISLIKHSCVLILNHSESHVMYLDAYAVKTCMSHNF